MELGQIAAAGMPALDVIQLSQRGAMDLAENNPAVNWIDDASGTFSFTVAPTLSTLLTGYRCRPHAGQMRGSFNVIAP